MMQKFLVHLSAYIIGQPLTACFGNAIVMEAETYKAYSQICQTLLFKREFSPKYWRVEKFGLLYECHESQRFE